METLEQQTETRADIVTTAYAKLLLTCMLMQYAISIEMKKNIAIGMKMLVDFEKLRGLLMNEKKNAHTIFTEQEIEESYRRTGFYQKIYSQIDDAALELNQKYFPMPRRPSAPEYACSEQKCKEAAVKIAHEYFPSLYGIKR